MSKQYKILKISTDLGAGEIEKELNKACFDDFDNGWKLVFVQQATEYARRYDDIRQEYYSDSYGFMYHYLEREIS